MRSIDVLRNATLAHDAVPPSPSPPPPSLASSPASPSSPHVVGKRVPPQLLGTGGAQATSLLKLKLKKVAAAKAAAKAADKGETSVETFTVRLERGPQGFGMVLNSSNRLTSLVPGGPAAQSQLLEWDLITKLDGLKLTGQLGAVAKGRDAMVLTVERPPERCHDSIIAREAVGYQTPFQSDSFLEESRPLVTPTPPPSSSQLQFDDQPPPPIGGYDQTSLLATQGGAAESIEVLSELLLRGTLPELRLPALQALYLALSDAEWAEEEEAQEEEAAEEASEEEAPSLHSSSWPSSSSSRGKPSSSPFSSPSSASPPAAAHAGVDAIPMLARTETREDAQRQVDIVGITSLLSRADATAGGSTAAIISSSASIASLALRPSLSAFTAPPRRFLVFPSSSPSSSSPPSSSPSSSSPSSPSFSSLSSLQAQKLPAPLWLSASAEAGALEAEVESEAEVKAEVGVPIADPSVTKLLARLDEQVH